MHFYHNSSAEYAMQVFLSLVFLCPVICVSGPPLRFSTFSPLVAYPARYHP